MPRTFDAIKRRLMEKEGMGEKQASAAAARISNATRKPGQSPTGRKHKGRRKS